MSTCGRCYWMKRRSHDAGVCWRYSVTVAADETHDCYEARTITVDRREQWAYKKQQPRDGSLEAVSARRGDDTDGRGQV